MWAVSNNTAFCQHDRLDWELLGYHENYKLVVLLILLPVVPKFRYFVCYGVPIHYIYIYIFTICPCQYNVMITR